MDYSKFSFCILFLTLQADFGSCIRWRTKEAFVCPEPDGVFPSSETECSGTYYLCIGGVEYEQNCPGTTVFDPKTKLCVSPQTISCQGVVTQSTTVSTVTPTTITTTDLVTESTSMSSSSTTTSTTTSNPIFTCPDFNGFYPIPDTCGSTYYTCIGGYPYLTTCPGGSIFDPVTLVCVSPESASCNFKCPQDNGFFPITSGECNNAYYACIGGESYLEHCPNDSLFDPNLLFCIAEGTGSC